jgi:gluconolactonase
LIAVEPIRGELDHPEAVIWDARREVLFCGGEAGQLYAVSLEGGVETVARTGGELLGLALDEAGCVYACDARAGRVVAVDPESATTAVLSDLAMSEPNGIALDPRGDLYVSDSGTWGGRDGRILRVSPGGPTEVWSVAAPAFPNGCLVRGDELFVVESGRHRVVAIPIEGDGSAGPSRPVLDLPPSVPDQLAFDSDGGFVVGCYRPDVVFYASAAGEVTRLVEDPTGIAVASPTGCAFAGRDLTVLVLAAFGGRGLLRLEPGRVGEPVARPARVDPFAGSYPQGSRR